jgi:uncharacterized protein (TIGR01777 family)
VKIKITGANGYLGKILSKQLIENGHEVYGIKREILYGSTVVLKNELKSCEILINLAGAPILQRWTKKNKRSIFDSRVQTTQNLVKAINLLNKTEQPKKFISASAIGIYKPNFSHDELSTNFASGFVGEVTKYWESALEELPKNVQKNTFRIGLILGKSAKIIQNLILPFKLGLGATIGTGKQAFPFIHEKDVIRAFVWVAENYEKNSVFNLVAPEQISNKRFTKTLAKDLNRPAFLFIPGFFLKLFLGEASSLLLESPIVEPKRLLEAGFEFKYPDIESSLSEILA